MHLNVFIQPLHPSFLVVFLCLISRAWSAALSPTLHRSCRVKKEGEGIIIDSCEQEERIANLQSSLQSVTSGSLSLFQVQGDVSQAPGLLRRP